MNDKNGKEIVVGNILYNDADRDKYHTVIQNSNGELFLGDFDSPLGRYSPDRFWEIVRKESDDNG